MPELEQKQFQKRQVAHKASISTIINGIFVKDNLSSGFLKLNDASVSRVNIIATIIQKNEAQNFASAIADDGTGRILLRSFENYDIFSKADIGDIVLVVGKIREYNNEKYVMPEIIKKLDNIGWMNLRKLELKSVNNITEDKKEGGVVEQDLTLSEDVYALVKKLDLGDGADIDDVIKNSKNKDAENTINRLLENGDIFEIKPGKLKVLE